MGKEREHTLLQGEKTWIRPLGEEDLDDLFTWYNDQEYNLWASGAWPLNTLLTKDEVYDRFLESKAECSRYAILAEDRKLVGSIGFRDVNEPARSATVFLGIGVKEYWGKGYGTDALITFCRFLFAQWNFHRLTLDTWDGNTRAIRAYEKAGFQIEGRLRQARFVLGSYRDAIIMGLLRDEFFELHPLPQLDSD